MNEILNDTMENVVTNEVTENLVEDVVSNDGILKTIAKNSGWVALGAAAVLVGKWGYKKVRNYFNNRKAKKQEPEKTDESLEGVVEDIEKQYPIEDK